MMKRINILTLLALLVTLAGCDYNDKYFKGYDNLKITDVGQYEGVFDGDYPAEGYFTDRTAAETEINAMLKKYILYPDKGYTAKITVMFGDITPGFSAADASYTLAKEDYDSMGEENGQPGKYDNFDDKMDIDGYLIEFLGTKYASMDLGKVVSVTYMYYATGAGTKADTRNYKKEVNGWHRVELNAFSADISYEMVVEDYDAMGTESGKPGRYDNFDANMDINMYISVMLNQKYPYQLVGSTAKVTYLYHIGGGKTESQHRFFQKSASGWSGFDPYGDTVAVTAKIAEMEYDGTNWVLKRLLGGSKTYTLERAHYQILLDWVKINKPAYMSTQNDYEEFYFGTGVAANYSNINNNYNTWKNYSEYKDLTTEQLQKVMDERIAEGIANHLLQEMIETPDPGLSYLVVYEVYQGRGSGNYMQAFMYNEDEKKYELVSNTPVRQ